MFSTPTKKSGSGSKSSPSPSSPPVSLSGFFETRIAPAWANASVTIAKAIPVTRRLIAPTTRGTSSPTAAVSASALHIPKPQCVIAMFVT